MDTENILPKFPYDVVSLILEYTTIGHIATTIKYCGSLLNAEERERLALKRNDPRGIFRPLTNNPDTLLGAMRLSKVVLSGSRALDYFNPGCTLSTSDYDFYGAHDTHCLSLFAVYMEDLGTQWAIPEDKGYTDSGLIVLHGILPRDGKVIKIQLMWRQHESASQCVMKFHSTAPQCFISGFAAVSLYHNLTSKYLAAEWSLNGNAGNFDDMSELHIALKQAHDIAVEKYKSRGFTYVDLAHRNPSAHTDGGWTRHIGDRECWLVPFDRYLDGSAWEHKFDTYIEALRYCSWKEC